MVYIKMDAFPLIIAAMIVIFVIVSSIAGYYYMRTYQCQNYANIACYNDWECPYNCDEGEDGPCWKGTEKMYKDLVNTCAPKDEEIPDSCSCDWAGTNASRVCNNANLGFSQLPKFADIV